MVQLYIFKSFGLRNLILVILVSPWLPRHHHNNDHHHAYHHYSPVTIISSLVLLSDDNEPGIVIFYSPLVSFNSQNYL